MKRCSIKTINLSKINKHIQKKERRVKKIKKRTKRCNINRSKLRRMKERIDLFKTTRV